jgi:mannose-1-phosphate guanylyltransferase/mannose-6-phosphate isomerase
VTLSSPKSAGYFWNSGNFMFRAAVLLDEYRTLDAGLAACAVKKPKGVGQTDGDVSVRRS